MNRVCARCGVSEELELLAISSDGSERLLCGTCDGESDEPECWVSQEALDNLHEEGSHVGTKTVLWNNPDSKNGKVRVALYRRPILRIDDDNRD